MDRKPSSVANQPMGMLSPIIAPPVNRLEGWTATIPTRNSLDSNCLVKDYIKVDLPLPGTPVKLITRALPRRRPISVNWPRLTDVRDSASDIIFAMVR